MTVSPTVGRKGGQEYDVARAIRTFLDQMSGVNGFTFGAAVIKELIQNADDAGATELVLTLDERSAADLAVECKGYGPLLEPALLVRNDARFRVANEVPAEDQDDFQAIRQVAHGHKRLSATAAGRFGIGFNSVYFLTDTPLLFSRREVDVFDLRHLMFEANGWQFSLDDFPADASSVGPIKSALDWALPKAVLGAVSFQEMAASGHDYHQTVFRLPLRKTLDVAPGETRGPVFQNASFPTEADRNALLRDMCDEARRSLLFLKSLRRVVFGGIVEKRFEQWACIEATRPASAELSAFVEGVGKMNGGSGSTKRLTCSFRCEVSAQVSSARIAVDSGTAAFQVTHVADSTIPELRQLGETLKRNDERAIPWVAIATPLNAGSFAWDGGRAAKWRVFLPLIEDGPCATILNAAMFVDPSRHAVAFRTEGSDETQRKSRWNCALTELLLVPLLREASDVLIGNAPDLIEQDPKKYLSLFPTTRAADDPPACLADVVRTSFNNDLWLLKLYDIWKESLDVFVGPGGSELRLERVAEWLTRYKGAFGDLSSRTRRFIAWNVGDAVSERLGDEGSVKVTGTCSDVADRVLLAEHPPQAKHLVGLLKMLGEQLPSIAALVGRWAFQREGGDSSLLRFDSESLYLVPTSQTPTVYETLRTIGISAGKVQWVAADIGLCAIGADRVKSINNIMDADATGALELLRRAGTENRHDLVAHHYIIVPVIDFLCLQSPNRLPEDLKLGFLVKTAHGKVVRRRSGIVFLRPEKPTEEEEDIWDGLLRGSFPEVDPQFAPHLRRLIAHAPHLRPCLSDDSCTVNLASGDLLDLLHDARVRDDSLVERLAQQFEQDSEGAGDRRQKYRAAALLVREADRRWESMGEALQETVLALPIHRMADGALTSLIDHVNVDPGGVLKRFFLQSEDDLRNAPVELPVGQLLHSLDPETRGFYRRRLRLRERGHVEVLKQCLRQIGEEVNRSGALLEYVERHYPDEVARLREGGHDEAPDLMELENLHRAARGIPCLDGAWHTADESFDATPLRSLLEKQGWKDKRLDELLCLLYPHPVAEGSSVAAKRARSVWKLEALDRDSLADAAITSGNRELLFVDRVRVIADNLRLVSDPPPRRATVLNSEECDALGGLSIFASLVLVDGDECGLSSDVIRAIVPEAADVARMAAKLTRVRVPVLAAVLRSLGVPIVNAQELRSRTVADFADIWPRLGTKTRLELLEWLGAEDGFLLSDFGRLDTVLVGVGDGEWVAPAAVIAPAWASPSPPNVPATAIARTDGIPQAVRRLWDGCCGHRDLDAVVGFVVRKTSELPSDKLPAAAKRLAQWLDKLAEVGKAEEVASALRDLPWVLARKGEEVAFHLAGTVVDHAGGEVLQNEFWVVAERIPTSLARFVHTHRMEGTRDVLEAIARCLTLSSSAPQTPVQSVYELLDELTSEENAKTVWTEVARSMAVYRLFRSTGRASDRMVTNEELFLGDQERKQDFGEVLYCFALGEGSKKKVQQLYEKLGVSTRPSARHLVGALSRMPSDARSGADVYRRLVDALTELPLENFGDLGGLDLQLIKVLSCARTFEPLSTCYVDPELDRPKRLAEDCRNRLADGRDVASKKMWTWLDRSFPGTVLRLRTEASAELSGEPEEVEGLTANVLDAWRDWLAELGTPGSVVRDGVEELKFGVPSSAVELILVAKIRVCFRLPDRTNVVPSDEWVGPELFHDSTGRILVRRDFVERDFVGNPDAVEELDGQMADMLERLLRAIISPGIAVASVGALRQAVRSMLERPSAVLKRMRDEKADHFFHQYLDQAADPEFSKIFDEYRRTSSTSTEKRERLKREMWDRTSLRFVVVRRDQIRGYGYDEFAIFAELVQNAEDAYAQRQSLQLPDPPSWSVVFTYSLEDGGRSLSVSHFGRPFNLWRHGAKQVESFRHDVEGVLKSAGSFKPHTATEGKRPIGRFGLGFKSVYLVTDAPRIHSGDWHFEITSGGIPNEIAAPDDYEKGLTRIVLPLTEEAREERDGERGYFATLLPFLRHVNTLRIVHSDGALINLETTSRTELTTADGHSVDRVVITGAPRLHGAAISMLRVRHSGHEGQLGMLLGVDGLPVAWSDAFESDVFAVLPLRVRLGCGIGVSNLFEVQSGRTHLINPEANRERIDEVVGSLRALVLALIAEESVLTTEALSRFWSVWHWDRSDEEANPLKRALACELVSLSRSMAMIPTLDPQTCVKLGAGVLFSFESLPEDLANTLLDKSVELSVAGERVHVRKNNVVPAPSRSAIERVFAAAGEKGGIPITGIGWSELSEEFQGHPWLADYPDLVSAMARNLSPEGQEQVRPWLGKCVFRSSSGKHDKLPNLLPVRFPGQNHLPVRFLNLLDEGYDEVAVGLLKQVGLPSRPPLESIKAWMRAGFRGEECQKLLRFLSDADRWRREYYDLQPLLASAWFDATDTRVTTAEAHRRNLVGLEDLNPDPAFRAWLGIDTGFISINIETARWDRPVPNPQRSLEEIWKWWSREGDNFVLQYDQSTYTGGGRPDVSGRFSSHDTVQRQNWLSLLMLASLQTMGRSSAEQHRSFMRQCSRQGWMDVFADPNYPADRWICVLDEYLGNQTNDVVFYHWMRQFVSIYQIARWLPEYVQSFLAIEKFKKKFDLDNVTRPATNPDFAGGGPIAPPLTRVLGIGACFVVRELLRAGVLKTELAHEHAYVAVGRVRSVLVRLGMTELQGAGADYRHSPMIHRFLLSHLGLERADFNVCFDLPFLAIAEDPALQTRFLDCQLSSEDEESV